MVNNLSVGVIIIITNGVIHTATKLNNNIVIVIMVTEEICLE